MTFIIFFKVVIVDLKQFINVFEPLLFILLLVEMHQHPFCCVEATVLNLTVEVFLFKSLVHQILVVVTTVPVVPVQYILNIARSLRMQALRPDMIRKNVPKPRYYINFLIHEISIVNLINYLFAFLVQRVIFSTEEIYWFALVSLVKEIFSLIAIALRDGLSVLIDGAWLLKARYNPHRVYVLPENGHEIGCQIGPCGEARNTEVGGVEAECLLGIFFE